MSSDTPRTENAISRLVDLDGVNVVEYVKASFARKLERELAAAIERGDKLLLVTGNMNELLLDVKRELSTVTAERDSLRQSNSNFFAANEKLILERSELTAERDAPVLRENSDLRAENERLKAEWKTMEMNWINVGQENERLRALLQGGTHDE